MATYRRRDDKDTWHWCRTCSKWPRSATNVATVGLQGDTRPSYGELCNECKGKEKNGDCRSAAG